MARSTSYRYQQTHAPPPLASEIDVLAKMKLQKEYILNIASKLAGNMEKQGKGQRPSWAAVKQSPQEGRRWKETSQVLERALRALRPGFGTKRHGTIYKGAADVMQYLSAEKWENEVGWQSLGLGDWNIFKNVAEELRRPLSGPRAGCLPCEDRLGMAIRYCSTWQQACQRDAELKCFKSARMRRNAAIYRVWLQMLHTRERQAGEMQRDCNHEGRDARVQVRDVRPVQALCLMCHATTCRGEPMMWNRYAPWKIFAKYNTESGVQRLRRRPELGRKRADADIVAGRPDERHTGDSGQEVLDEWLGPSPFGQWARRAGGSGRRRRLAGEAGHG